MKTRFVLPLLFLALAVPAVAMSCSGDDEDAVTVYVGRSSVLVQPLPPLL